MKRPRRGEVIYVTSCLGLLLTAAIDGGEHVWPYLALVTALLPIGLVGVFLAAIAAGALPEPLATLVVAGAVIAMATTNVALVRSARELHRVGRLRAVVGRLRAVG